MATKEKFHELLALAVTSRKNGKVEDANDLFAMFCDEVEKASAEKSEELTASISNALASLLVASTEDTGEEEEVTTESAPVSTLDAPDELESLNLDADDEPLEVSALDGNEDFDEDCAIAAIAASSDISRTLSREEKSRVVEEAATQNLAHLLSQG